MKLMNCCFFENILAIFIAASTLSAPLLEKKTFFLNVPGVMDSIDLAASTCSL
jgi:hypothetical protein